MSKQDTIDNIMPSAAPTEDEIRRWRALPPEEQRRRVKLDLEQAYHQNRNSTEPLKTMAEIREEARAIIKDHQG